jgi:hypothetical protein
MTTTEEKNQAEADKKAAEDAKVAAKAAADHVKQEAKKLEDERNATKAHAVDVIQLRGMARICSQIGQPKLEMALDKIATSLVTPDEKDKTAHKDGKGVKRTKEDALLEIAIALKNDPKNWDLMVAKIEAVAWPAIIEDRSLGGILRAVAKGDITEAQAEPFLHLTPGAQSNVAALGAPTPQP